MSVGAKLRIAREAQPGRISREDVAAIQGDGSNYGRIASYELGRAEPPRDLVAKLAARWGVPFEWWYDGKEGPPPSAPETSSSLVPDGTSANPTGETGMVPTASRALFPILGSVGAAAAPLRSADADPDDFVEFSERLFRPERFAVRVSGHSGGDEIHHGDYLLVQPEEVPRHGFVTVLGRADEFVVKVAVRTPDGKYTFEAFDPEYPPIEVDGEWHVVGYACGISRETRRGRYSEEGDDGGFTARKMANGRWGIE